MKKGVIYCTTNLINGKKYIGQDSNDNSLYLGSSIRLKRAIKKHGKEFFIKEILQNNCVSKRELDEAERYWIDYFGAVRSDLFYNLADGGSGGMSELKKKDFVAHPNSIKALLENRLTTHSKESRKLMRQARLGSKMPEKTRKAIYKSRARPVVQLTKQGELVNQFDDIVQAANSFVNDELRSTQIHAIRSSISEVIKSNNHKRTCRGFRWMCLEEYKRENVK